jgi:outer membrane protein with beta-barrel domain
MTKSIYIRSAIPFLTIFACFLLPDISTGQTDSTQIVQPDTLAQQLPQETGDTKEKKEKKKKKNSIKLYVGVNFNELSVPDNLFESNTDVGYQIGVAYKKGGFFYWEIGARYNSASYDLTSTDSLSSFKGSFGVSQIDLPMTGGINFLSVTSRLLGLRVFVSAVPSLVIGVSEEDIEVSKDDFNSFGFYGAGGIGVDVAFFFLEAGLQYGFIDLLQNVSSSNHRQFFVNLGFRF